MFDQRLPNEKGKVVVTDARAWEKRIDELFDLAATTFDEAKRHEYFNEWQEIAYEQLPFTYLYTVLDITAARNTIGNYMPTPLGIFYTPLGSLHNLEEIYFKYPSSHSGAASRALSWLPASNLACKVRSIF
jgi:ABC-type transport system substrate-binding protein